MFDVGGVLLVWLWTCLGITTVCKWAGFSVSKISYFL